MKQDRSLDSQSLNAKGGGSGESTSQDSQNMEKMNILKKIEFPFKRSYNFQKMARKLKISMENDRREREEFFN